MFDYYTQREIGNAATSIVIDWMVAARHGFWGGGLEWVEDVQERPADWYRGDIKFSVRGKLYYLELKRETRTSGQTPNLAVETISNDRTGKRGGPFGTSADFYAHIYACGLFCVMDTAAVCRYVGAHKRQFRPFYAQNDGFTTRGVLVPRRRMKRDLGRHYIEFETGA